MAGLTAVRRAGAVAFAVAVAACASGPEIRTLSAPGWEGCLTADLQGTVRGIRCGGVDLRVMRAQTLGGDLGIAAVARRINDGDDGQPDTIRTGDRDLPARVGDGWIVAAPRQDVLAYCQDRDPGLAGCRAAITAVARDGLPPGVAFPETRLVLLRRALTVPDGCQLVGSERIACAATGVALDWREQKWSGGADGVLDASVQLLRARFAQVEEKRLPCTLVGRAGSGARYDIRTEAGLTRAFACVVVQDGVASAAQCQGPLRPDMPFPAPCDQVLQGP